MNSIRPGNDNLPSKKLWARPLGRVAIQCLLLMVALTGFQSQSDLDSARERWAAQSISHYRIVIEYSVPLFNCQQDIEVRNEVVDYKHQDSCAISVTQTQEYFTISNLFQRIEDYINSPLCGPNGCACDGPISVDVAYHPEQGYPQQIVYQLHPERRWFYGEYWQALLSGTLQQCPPINYIGETITVQSLAPLESTGPIPDPSVEKAPTAISEITPTLSPTPE